MRTKILATSYMVVHTTRYGTSPEPIFGLLTHTCRQTGIMKTMDVNIGKFSDKTAAHQRTGNNNES